MVTETEGRPAVTVEQRRAIVQEADGIMALEGFVKTAPMIALDEAYIQGQITLDQKRDFLLLEARITGAKSVLACIGNDDPRFADITQRCQVHEGELRSLAVKMGHGIGVAFGL